MSEATNYKWIARSRRTVIVRSARERPKKRILQWKRALTRFFEPVRKVRCTTNRRLRRSR
jgi:hypothetical protein